MKKRLTKAITLVVLVTTLFSLCACGKSIKGTWVTSEGSYTYTYVFEKGGTGYYYYSYSGYTSSPSVFTYTAKDGVLTVNEDGDIEMCSYSISKNTLTLTSGSDVMIFTKMK
ncbi:MAG: lipocalin family protein [Lachnospira sp.]